MPVFRTSDFPLQSGAILPELDIAYEAYGSLSPAKDNAILVFHGLTSSHHAAGEATRDRRRGWWNRVIGPGCVFDTNHHYIISSNMLGSSYGSTGPSSRNPLSGKPYGLDFPQIDFDDIVAAQHLMLRHLGIEKLLAVAGSSYGGYLAFQWAVAYPEFMRGVIAMDTAPRDTFDSGKVAEQLVDRFARESNWNDGNDLGGTGLQDNLTRLRIDTLKSYGFEEQLSHIADLQERIAIIEDTARDWAREFDPVALIRLWQATSTFNAEALLQRIRAPLLYILADTDQWFPASLGRDVMKKLLASGVDARFLEVHSRHGHYATTEEPEKWTAAAAAFLASLERR